MIQDALHLFMADPPFVFSTVRFLFCRDSTEAAPLADGKLRTGRECREIRCAVPLFLGLLLDQFSEKRFNALKSMRKVGRVHRHILPVLVGRRKWGRWLIAEPPSGCELR